MLGKVAVLFDIALLTSFLTVSVGAQSSGDSLFPDSNQPLFSGSLFSDEPVTAKLNNDISTMNKPAAAPGGISAASGAMDRKIQFAQIDQEMRGQMRGTARYLKQYCLMNSQRWPAGLNDETNSTDNMYSVQVQLYQLYPNNPYNYGPTETQTWGIPTNYNSNGSAATGSPVWADQWTQSLQNQQNNRFNLLLDPNLRPMQVDDIATHPPSDWTAAPGTITAIGNNQGFFIIWGAGADGKPIRNPANGLIMIIAVTTSGVNNDTTAPNEI